MSVSVTHSMVSAVPDEGDTTLVRPSDWNAGHIITGLTDADEKAKVSSNDTTAGYLNGKLVAGTNITLTENNDGSNETLTIAASGGGGAAISQSATIAQSECWFNANTDVYDGRVKQDASGTSAAISAGGDEDGHPGMIQLSTGSTSSGRCALIGGNDIPLGSGAVSGTVVLKIVNLSTVGVQQYTVRSGMSDVSSGDAQDGIFFRYTDSVNSGKWEACTANNNSITATDTGVTVAGSTWYRLGFAVNAAGSSVVFSINGSTVATVGTNIPTGLTRATSFMPASIVKSVGGSGRTCLVDAYWYNIAFTTPR